jgi:hypothetical protein
MTHFGHPHEDRTNRQHRSTSGKVPSGHRALPRPPTPPRRVRNKPHRGGVWGARPPSNTTNDLVCAFRRHRSPVVRGAANRCWSGEGSTTTPVRGVFSCEKGPAICVRSARGCVRTPTAGLAGCSFGHAPRGVAAGEGATCPLPSARGQAAGVRHACAGRVTGGLRRRREAAGYQVLVGRLPD